MRSVQQTFRVVVSLSLVALLAGCSAGIRPPMARRPEGLPSANRGQSSAMVFSGPRVAAAMADVPEWVRPEYARNNGHLVFAPPRALTAIDEWPQPAPPSIERQRRTTLSRQAGTILFFEQPGRGREFGRGRGYNRRHYSPRPR